MAGGQEAIKGCMIDAWLMLCCMAMATLSLMLG